MTIPRNARRFNTHMTVGLSASDELYGDFEVVIVYTVSPGSPQSLDDPGSPPEVTVHGIQTLHGPVKDLTWVGTTWIEEDEEMCAALVADWIAYQQAAADDAAEDRADEARLERRS